MTTTTVLDYLLSFTSNLPPEKIVLALLSLHTPGNFTHAPRTGKNSKHPRKLPSAPGRLGPWKKSPRPESSLKLQVGVPAREKI
jgi:hypothetical protein